MEKVVDLHTHTYYSDGTASPRELMETAVQAGLSAIAVTDHDTVAGVDEAAKAARDAGIEFIPAIELNALEMSELHIVGLFIDHHAEPFRRALEEMSESRCRRSAEMVEKLRDAGVPLTMEMVMEEAAGAESPARIHIARAIVRCGMAKDNMEAMKKFLAKGTAGYVLRGSVNGAECIRIIHEAGGLAFLAHLNQIQLTGDDLEQLLHRLANSGLDGIETRYAEYDADWRSRCDAWQRKFGFLASGGSDYHGANKPNRLRDGLGDLQVPYAFVERMKEKLGK